MYLLLRILILSSQICKNLPSSAWDQDARGGETIVLRTAI